MLSFNMPVIFHRHVRLCNVSVRSTIMCHSSWYVSFTICSEAHAQTSVNIYLSYWDCILFKALFCTGFLLFFTDVKRQKSVFSCRVIFLSYRLFVAAVPRVYEKISTGNKTRCLTKFSKMWLMTAKNAENKISCKKINSRHAPRFTIFRYSWY